MLRSVVLALLLFCGGPSLAVGQSVLKRETDWTVAEVKEWVEHNRNYSTWHGRLLYQGSDSTKHHFISRINDDWVWFAIDHTSIPMPDEQPYRKTSSAPLGYYYVDAANGFLKLKDYR